MRKLLTYDNTLKLIQIGLGRGS